jgi:deoxyribonuclease-4
VLDETAALGSGIAMETTAGQGTGLGYLFEHLATVIEGAGGSARLGVCLDTCHIFAAGYDIRDADSFREMLDRFDATIGLDRLRLIHVNDAKKPLGSRVDRHEHLGKGEVGEEAFRLLVNEPRLASIPLVLETPESETMHKVNLELLRGLQAA